MIVAFQKNIYLKTDKNSFSHLSDNFSGHQNSPQCLYCCVTPMRLQRTKVRFRNQEKGQGWRKTRHGTKSSPSKITFTSIGQFIVLNYTSEMQQVIREINENETGKRKGLKSLDENRMLFTFH